MAVTVVEVVELPAVSTARAAIVWLPLATDREFQLIVVGALTWDATVTPSTRKSTWSMATLSEALAEICAKPDSVAPLEGAVSETVGGVVSGVPAGVVVHRQVVDRDRPIWTVRPKLSPLTPLG